ncbi:MAG: lytic murein transglycosylase [Rhizobiales bacterium]|nr:lytic murein transglycosylase [Hyphomicrobiales bacterium]
MKELQPPMSVSSRLLRRLVVASAAATLSSAVALAQDVTGSIGKPSSAPAWSGTDGASGHPAMTAQAIREAAANFPACVAQMWPLAAQRGISRDSFVRFTSGLTPDLRIMDLMDAQPEFTKAFWEYLDILVNENRLQKGREILQTYKAAFDAMERIYGVDRHVVASIWGIESNYGTMGGDRPVLRSTATLACVGRRQNYFREEFLSALEIVHRGDVRPEQFKGSWPGAFGQPQFMPTSFKRYAIDFDGDGHRDVVSSASDVIGSTANNLKKDGWQAGHTWGYEVVLPQGFDLMYADRSKQFTLGQWEKAGIRRADGSGFPRPQDRAYLLVPAGARGPAFLMLNNFRVIMKYNPAEAYALAIGHFADRLRGGPAFVQAWPRDERVLSRSERYELQQHLAARGYDVGEPDGRLGPKTRIALRQFQQSVGLAPDGFASGSVLSYLRGQASR